MVRDANHKRMRASVLIAATLHGVDAHHIRNAALRASGLMPGGEAEYFRRSCRQPAATTTDSTIRLLVRANALVARLYACNNSRACSIARLMQSDRHASAAA